MKTLTHYHTPDAEGSEGQSDLHFIQAQERGSPGAAVPSNADITAALNETQAGLGKQQRISSHP